MGKLIAKQIRGMNLWAKVALTVLFTFALSVFMYEGWYKPTSLQAAPGILDAWTNVSSTAPANISGTVTTSSVTASADATSTRLFLVAVALEVGTGNTTVSTMNVSYGGVALTPIGNTGATSAREHVYMGYLKDSQIPAGANAITVQYGLAANTVTGLHVNWATYTGVDQTTPINSSNAVATALATVTFGTTINYVANGLTLYCAANGGTPVTMTAPSGFTQDIATTTSAHTSFIADTATHATAGSYASTTTVTFAGTTSTRSGIVVASLRPSAAVNTTAAGAATAVAASSSTINVSMPFTNDANNNSTYTIDYKLTSSGTWTNWVTAAAHATSPYTNTITGLVAGTSYDVRVTYNDADGVTGTNPQTISGVITAAENRTTAGTATATAASSSSINVSMPFTTDANNNSTYTVEYKQTSSGTWLSWVTAAPHATSPYTTTITGLAASTSYDVRATYIDADGVIGTNPQTISGVVTSAAAPLNSTTAGTASVAPGSVSIQVTAPYTNDANANNTLKVEWGTGGTYTLGTQTLTHVASPYAYTINGLTASTAYNVRVTYQDADTVTGSAVQTFTPTTLAFSSPLMHTAANVNPGDTKGYGATWGSTFTCATCHVDGSSNVKIVSSTVDTPNGPRSVVFTRMTATSDALNGVFGNDARTYAGNGTGGSTNICEVCHRKTTFHRYSTNAPTLSHYNNRLCLPCHPHSAGFKGSGHTVPMYATAAGHTGCASGIGCHANTNPAAPYPTAGTAPDCRSCHTKGDPTTANIGCGSCHGAANGNGEPVGTVHPDNAGSHAAHTSIPTACTYCHDTGGTGGNADHGKGNRGANPAIVNLAASFTWNGTSCSTASCHANVYGAGTVASPTWGTAAGCTACHSVAIGATGPATGSHPAHTTAVCTDCHAAGTTATSAPSTGHADGNVDVLDGYPANVAKHTAGTYTGTCTTASCHANVYGAGNTTSPVWGTAAGCTACHSVAIGATGPATGSHPAHTTAVCTDCHAAGTTATTAPSTGHADGNVDILDGYPTNVAKHAAGTYTGTCTTASCHANVYGAGNTTSPVWGTAAGCTACHSVAIGATGPATGSHAAHTTAVCTDCHAAGTTATTAPSTGHADGNVDVLDGYPANVAKHASGTYTGTCTTASCHSNVYGAGNTTSPVWGTAAGCTACHSVAIGATGPATGSHAAHTTAVCTDCHAAGTTATTAPSTGHANGNIDVLDGYPTNVAKHAAGTYTGTCTTASCHSNVYGAGNTTTPVWGTAAGCTACHSVAIGVNGPATGSHDAHVGSLCTACHAAGTTQTTSPTTGHADGNIDVLNGYPANVAKHAAGTYTGTCSSASCHVSAYGAGNTTSPVWGTAGGCGSCHPIDVTGAPATGSHAPHLAYTTLVNCGSCHAGAVKDTSGGSAHTDGNIDVINGYPANVAKHAAGTYTGNCANTYCHSNGTSVATAAIPANTSPTWGVASGCTVCHSFPPAYANNTPKKNSHSAGGHSITCDNCHYNTTTNGTTVTTVANHVNSAYNVNPNTSKGIAFTYTFATGGGTCATVSCHGTAQWGVTVMDCVSCHTSAVNITKGPLAGQSLQRRAIQPEFLATWSHKNSDNHNVYKQDCIVCHMEGNKATGGTSSVHGDGYINLRDADTGVEITNVTWNGGTPGAFVTASGNASFSRFSRNLTVTMEADPAFLTLAAIEVNHCLSCHDADGAMHADAQVPTTGTAGRPFGVAVGATSTDAWTVAAGNTTSNVVNVASSFDTANASYHPVLGKANNGYAGGTKMKAPWNGTLTPAKPGAGSTTVYGFLISCWDCHADVDTGTITDSVTAHGNGTTIRANVGIAHPNLCTKCHADTYGTTSGQHGTGSALTTGNGNIGSNIYTCQNCHSAGSAYNIRPWRGVDAHGFNVFAQVRSNTAGAAAGAATWTSGAKPWAFIRTNNLSGWRPARGTGLTDATTGTCGPNGVSPCSNSHGTYTPGGYY